MNSETDAFVDRLTRMEPLLKPALDEHRKDNDGVLPHVFMGDVARWAIRMTDSSETERLRRTLDFMEHEYGDGKSDVANVIGASFVEYLVDEPAVVRQFGPRLTHSYRVLVGLDRLRPDERPPMPKEIAERLEQPKA